MALSRLTYHTVLVMVLFGLSTLSAAAQIKPIYTPAAEQPSTVPDQPPPPVVQDPPAQSPVTQTATGQAAESEQSASWLDWVGRVFLVLFVVVTCKVMLFGPNPTWRENVQGWLGLATLVLGVFLLYPFSNYLQASPQTLVVYVVTYLFFFFSTLFMILALKLPNSLAYIQLTLISYGSFFVLYHLLFKLFHPLLLLRPNYYLLRSDYFSDLFIPSIVIGIVPVLVIGLPVGIFMAFKDKFGDSTDSDIQEQIRDAFKEKL